MQPVLQGRRMNPIPEYLDEVVHVGIAHLLGHFTNREVGGNQQPFGLRDAQKDQVILEGYAHGFGKHDRERMAGNKGVLRHFVQRQGTAEVLRHIALGGHHCGLRVGVGPPWESLRPTAVQLHQQNV